MKRWLIVIMMVIILLLSVNAATLAGTVQALRSINVFSQMAKIYINGSLFQPRVEPVVLADQGVTLVPLRALAEALGKNVTWDPATLSIHISSEAPSPPPAAPLRYDLVENLKVLRNLGPFFQQPKKPFHIAGRPFDHGIGVTVDQGAVAEVVLDLNEKYRWARGFLGVEDAHRNSSGAFRLEIYAEDTRELYVSHIVRPAQYPLQFTLPSLEGVNRITFRVTWAEGSKIGDKSAVTAALVDFRFFHK